MARKRNVAPTTSVSNPAASRHKLESAKLAGNRSISNDMLVARTISIIAKLACTLQCVCFNGATDKFCVIKARKIAHPKSAAAWLKKVADGGRFRASKAGPQMASAAAASSKRNRPLAEFSTEIEGM